METDKKQEQKMSPEDVKMMEDEAKKQHQPKRPPFRGVVVHMQVDGKFGLEMVGVTPLEIFGVLTLILEKMKKDLGGN